MAPRLHIDRELAPGATFDLPAAQSRHVQVLRLQPGAALTLFNGAGGEWRARVSTMGRAIVGVAVEAHLDVDRELPLVVTLALGMPANERMDALVEKATELGVAAIQPLVCERSVLRLAGERASKRQQHWQSVAIAASEQSGRTRVPQIHAVRKLSDWLAGCAADEAFAGRLYMLSLGASLRWEAGMTGPSSTRLVFLSGPEGGLTANEEAAALRAGYTPLALGPRILRADTAPLAALAALAGCQLAPD